MKGTEINSEDLSWRPPQAFEGHFLSILPDSDRIFPHISLKQTSPAFKKSSLFPRGCH